MSIKISLPTVRQRVDKHDADGKWVCVDPKWFQLFNILAEVAQEDTTSGTTANRPTAAATNVLWVGFRYFDTTLGKPIWLKSTSPNVWVDATGAVV